MVLQYFVRYDEESGTFVSHSPFHGVYSAGNSREEALAALDSAIQMHLEVILLHRLN